MKKLIYLILLPALFLAIGCEKEVDEPDVCYELSYNVLGEDIMLTEPYTVSAGTQIDFSNCGWAMYYAFFNGKEGSVYEDFLAGVENVVGSEAPLGNANVTYDTPGVYTATMVLTNIKPGDNSDMKRVAVNFVITVTEAVVEE